MTTSRLNSKSRQTATRPERIPVYDNPEQVLWTHPSGQALIISGTQHGATRAGSVNIGATADVLRQGRLTQIPWSTRSLAVA